MMKGMIIMLDNFSCPYCQSLFAIHSSTYRSVIVCKDGYFTNSADPSAVEVEFFICPKCKKITVKSTGYGAETYFPCTPLLPNSTARKFPDYIPESIRRDYEEACAIINLSPKASATLSRRCLQGMIRDFFQISKNSLYEEIDAIKTKIPAEQWAVLDGLRRIGNIGAHMEKDINLIIDIEPDEAQKLIKLIELLIQQWYIERHNQEQLYADIIGIDNSKQALRKKSE